jgi:hypothetical protein
MAGAPIIQTKARPQSRAAPGQQPPAVDAPAIQAKAKPQSKAKPEQRPAASAGVADLLAQQKVTADRKLLDAAAIISVDSSSSDDAWGEWTANAKRDGGENSDDAWGEWMANGKRDLSGGPEAV